MDNSILIISTNWIGDAIMSMPAVEIFRAENPLTKITVLTKPGLQPLWRMHPAVDEIQLMKKPFATARRLRKNNYSAAIIFPNSFRSAFVPFLAGIPVRAGACGDCRRLLLTQTVAVPNGHQQFEYMNLLGVQGDPPPPAISVPADAIESVKEKIKIKNKTLITILPGAARGPSKRWPAENFAAVAKRLNSKLGAQIIFSGGADDAAVCDEISSTVGGISLAGKTTIQEWAALLKISDCVISNDSGGMHLATAVGTPVAAVFGITDPSKTGPLGRAAVLQKSEFRARDIARHSEEAIRALAAVTPDDVFAAAVRLLGI